MLAIWLASIAMIASASDRKTNPQARVITTNICIDSLVVALIGTESLVAVSALANDDRYSHISDEVKDLQKVTFNADDADSLNLIKNPIVPIMLDENEKSI